MKEQEIKFAVDIMLGRLAKWLRLMGWDTIYVPLNSFIKIQEYIREGRIVITRQKKWSNIEKVLFIRSNEIDRQIKEVFDAYALKILPERFLSRCVHCNVEILECSRESARGRVPEYIWHTHKEFFACPRCNRIYWSGSHIPRIQNQLNCWLGKKLSKEEKNESS